MPNRDPDDPKVTPRDTAESEEQEASERVAAERGPREGARRDSRRSARGGGLDPARVVGAEGSRSRRRLTGRAADEVRRGSCPGLPRHGRRGTRSCGLIECVGAEPTGAASSGSPSAPRTPPVAARHARGGQRPLQIRDLARIGPVARNLLRLGGENTPRWQLVEFRRTECATCSLRRRCCSGR